MNPNINYKKYFFLTLVTGVVLSFLLFRQCSQIENIKTSRESVQNYLTDTLEHYRNKEGQMVAEKTALLGEKDNLTILLNQTSTQLKKLTEKFNKVSAAGEIITVTEIDTIKVPFEVPVPFEFSRDWSKVDEFYSIYGRSTNFGITIDSLSIPNTLSFVVGEKKTGFWKSEYRIEAVNSNKYILTTGLDAYSFSQPKKRFGLSVYAGYGLGQNFTLTPQIGLGVTFDLIRF